LRPEVLRLCNRITTLPLFRQDGCTEAEWLGWLPAAIGAHAWQRDGQSVHIELHKHESEPESASASSVCIRWSVGEPRVIALMRIPRLHVQFDFNAADAGAALPLHAPL
jgi:hypothetical protein